MAQDIPREEGNAAQDNPADLITATDAAPVALGKKNQGRQDGATGDESPWQGPYVQEQTGQGQDHINFIRPCPLSYILPNKELQ